jgi:hypothetical protein
MKKPILYLEALTTNKQRLAFDFCYSAKMGAEQCGIKVKAFQNISDVSNDPTNIVVGSVETCSLWLQNAGFQIPNAVDISLFQEFLGRNITVIDIQDVKFPSFIKPYSKIKAFTGFVAIDKLYVSIFSENYKGLVWSQDVVEIISEYRLYINCHKIIGMKHCRGDCLSFPDVNFIKICVNKSIKILDYHAYTLDFGVLEDGSTILIEINDGFAIGNYGLEPLDYYYFIRNRWLQLTGIRHRMEGL